MSIQPGVGNLFVEEDHEKNYCVLRQMTFLFFLIVAVAACGLYVMIDSFVEDIWLGKTFGWDSASVFLSVTGCIFLGIGQPIAVVMAVSGLFHREKTLSVLSSVVNLIVSIALVIPFGTAGVLLGTCLAYLIQIGYRIYFFFHEYVKMDEKRYVFDLLEYGVLIAVEVIVTKQVVHLVYCQSLFTFLLGVGICVFIPMTINVSIFCRSGRLKSVRQLFSSVRR